MKKYTIIYIVGIFVLTAAIIAVALGLRFRGGFSGCSIGKLGSVSSEMVSQTVSVDAFTEIEIDADAIDFEVKRGSDYYVEYNVPAYMLAKAETHNGKLDIEMKSSVTPSITFAGKNFTKDSFKFTVFIPDGASLEELSAKIDAGKITLNDISVEKIGVDTDAADIQMSGVQNAELKVKADAGNVEIKNSTLGSVNVEADAANIRLDSFTAGKIDASSDAGNIEFTGATFEEGNFESSMGNISIEGSFDKVTADCSLGAISIDPANPDARINASVDLGSIEISGKNVKGTSYNQ